MKEVHQPMLQSINTTKLISHRNALWVSLAIITAVVALLAYNFSTKYANALTSSDFNPGYIIDDQIFTNSESMSVNEIQTFLNTKVPTCDTSGSKPSEMNNSGVPDYNNDSTIQRWEWGKYKFDQTTFICLKSYTENSKSAAQIIYDTAVEFSINPQVILVLLQKEQGLITDTWPLNIQYRSATGYGCPDTAECDAQYYGFTNQVRWAATMYRAIMTDSPTWYTPYVLGNNYIRYNPNSSCGGSVVNIQNRATQALYNYTPYQPNSDTLSYILDGGTYVSSAYPDCGAFGNINFFKYFTEWFGLPINLYRIEATPFDSTTDSSGEQGKIGYRLNKKPTNSVTFYLKVSSPSNARIAGTNKVTITPDTWDDSTRNVVLISGLSNPALDGTFQYAVVPDGKTTSSDSRYHNITPPSINMLQLQTSNQAVYSLYSSTSQQHQYTSNKSVVSNLESNGYTNEGPKFYYCKAGEQSIVRLVSGDDYRLVKYLSQDYIDLLNSGYAYGELDFSTSIHGYIPVYWLYNNTLGTSLYTTSSTEVADAIGTGFTDNGIAFYSCSSDQTPVYRLYRKSNNSHFYTKSEAERNYALNVIGYRYEQVGYYTCATGDPVYRLYRESNNSHFYTTSEAERDSIVASGQYRDEGQQFYTCPTGDPVYRLYRESNNSHFYTTSEAERIRLSSNGFRDEGARFTAN
jgi:hypothetical protein